MTFTRWALLIWLLFLPVLSIVAAIFFKQENTVSQTILAVCREHREIPLLVLIATALFMWHLMFNVEGPQW